MPKAKLAPRPTRLLQVVGDSAAGGVPGQVYLLLQYINRADFEVAVACRTNGPFYQAALKLGVTVLPVKLESQLDWRGLLTLWRFCRQWKPQIVHTHASRAGLVGRLAAWLSGCSAIVHSPHGLQLTTYHSLRRVAIFQKFEQGLGLITKRLVACSFSEAQFISRLKLVPPSKLITIENGIELDHFYRASEDERRAMRAKLGLEPDCLLVGMVCRLTYQKAPHIFIEVAAQVAKICPEARFIVAGDGPLRVELEVRAARLGLAGRLFFWGEQSNSTIVELLAALDVFMLTSLWEGLPLVILEAMAAKLAVVATAATGTADLVKPGETGLLAAVNAVEELTAQLLNLLYDPVQRERLAQNGYNLVQGGYNISQVVPRFEQLYSSLVSGK